MTTEITEDQLQSLYAWIDGIPLSRPKRNIARDFSDAVPAAEVIKSYIPKLVDLHNYPPANSVSQKLYNWNTLNQKVLRKLGINLADDLIQNVVSSKPGFIEALLVDLQQRLEHYRAQKSLYRNGGSRQGSFDSVNGVAPASAHQQLQQQQQIYAANGVPMPMMMDPNAAAYYQQQQQQQQQVAMFQQQQQQPYEMAYGVQPQIQPMAALYNNGFGFAPQQQQLQQQQAVFNRAAIIPPIPQSAASNRSPSAYVSTQEQQQQIQQRSLPRQPAPPSHAQPSQHRPAPYRASLSRPNANSDLNGTDHQRQQQQQQYEQTSQRSQPRTAPAGAARAPQQLPQLTAKSNSRPLTISTAAAAPANVDTPKQGILRKPRQNSIDSDTAAESSKAQQQQHQQHQVAVLELKLKEKDLLVNDLHETVSILQLKIQKLEQLVMLKERRLEELSAAAQ